MPDPGVSTVADTAVGRVVQLSDTHLSHRLGVPERMQWLLDRIADDPPDLVVVTGDIVYEDPDDDADRSFAHVVLTSVACPTMAIPGNHDIGFYGEDEARTRRLALFCQTWEADRFSIDIAGWRLVGANAYLLGEPDHDAWLTDAVTSDLPIALFVHQPVGGDPADGWEMPADARHAFDRATNGADVRLIASGHRHRSFARGRIVWAPSATLVGETCDDGTDPNPGAVEFTFRGDGTFESRFVRP